MAGAKLERTRWPGIYRRGDRWAYEWTDAAGKRRRGTADTREDVSARKATEEAKAARGEFGEAGPRSRLTAAAYALDLFGADLDRPAGGAPARGRYVIPGIHVQESPEPDHDDSSPADSGDEAERDNGNSLAVLGERLEGNQGDHHR